MSLLAAVPTLVVAGRRDAGKTTLIGRLLAERPDCVPWAVLVNERGRESVEPAPGVAVARVDGGCMCCTAQVNLRVALTRLLREARPARLFIELNAASHVPEVLRTLRSPWLAPVVALDAIVEVIDSATFRAAGDASVRIAPADVLCVRGDTAPVLLHSGGTPVVAVERATLAALQRTTANDSR